MRNRGVKLEARDPKTRAHTQHKQRNGTSEVCSQYPGRNEAGGGGWAERDG